MLDRLIAREWVVAPAAMVMVFLTRPLGLIARSGILMRNTPILIGPIYHNDRAGPSPFDAVVEAMVQRARPVLLTALAAVLPFVTLPRFVFRRTMADTLVGGILARRPEPES